MINVKGNSFGALNASPAMARFLSLRTNFGRRIYRASSTDFDGSPLTLCRRRSSLVRARPGVVVVFGLMG